MGEFLAFATPLPGLACAAPYGITVPPRFSGNGGRTPSYRPANPGFRTTFFQRYCDFLPFFHGRPAAAASLFCGAIFHKRRRPLLMKFWLTTS
jgi:hypothetical protein